MTISKLKTINVIIVEADNIIRDNLSEYFASLGYSVEDIETEIELFELMQDKPAQIILLDYAEKSDATRITINKLKAKYPTIVIMIMMSNPTIERILTLVDLGIQNILLKPISLNECELHIENASIMYSKNVSNELFNENKKIILELLSKKEISVPNCSTIEIVSTVDH